MDTVIAPAPPHTHSWPASLSALFTSEHTCASCSWQCSSSTTGPFTALQSLRLEAQKHRSDQGPLHTSPLRQNALLLLQQDIMLGTPQLQDMCSAVLMISVCRCNSTTLHKSSTGHTATGAPTFDCTHKSTPVTGAHPVARQLLLVDPPLRRPPLCTRGSVGVPATCMETQACWHPRLQLSCSAPRAP